MTDNPILLLALAAGGAGIFLALARLLLVTQFESGPDALRAQAGLVRRGALSFLSREYLVGWVIAILLGLAVARLGDWVLNGFVAGLIASALAGYFGLRVALSAAPRTAAAAGAGVGPALAVAFRGANAIGLMSTGLALVSLAGTLWLVRHQASLDEALRASLGLALGGAVPSLLGRVAGGLYAKSADVGADQVGKAEAGFADGDRRNAGTLADLVGDHASGVALGADLFETYVLILVIAMWLGKSAFGAESRWVELPLALAGLGLVASIVGGYCVRVGRRPRIIGALYRGALAAALAVGAGAYYGADYFFALPGVEPAFDRLSLTAIVAVGLALLPVVAIVTEYHTAQGFGPARRVALAAESGPATNVIAGLAVGMRSTFWPVAAVGAGLVTAYYLGGGFGGAHGPGLYAIALAAVGLVGLTGTLGSLAAFGTIADNAAGLAVLAELPEDARRATDLLDGAGHTGRAVVQGYALATTSLAGLLLLAGFANAFSAPVMLDLSDPLAPLSLLGGALLPYWLGGRLFEGVGATAGLVASEVRRQWRDGADGAGFQPDRCVDIAARNFMCRSLVAVFVPLAVPVGVGLWLGPQALAGLLLGSLAAGLPLALSLTHGGGVWDSARRHIEAGRLGGLRSSAHRSALAGDAVGDASRGAAGAALAPLLKTLSLASLLVVPLLS